MQGPPGNTGGGASSVYAWLIPPLNTTALGFWATLGCGTSGTISVEFDVVNDDPVESSPANMQSAAAELGSDEASVAALRGHYWQRQQQQRQPEMAPNTPRRLLGSAVQPSSSASAMQLGSRRLSLLPQQNLPGGGWETRDTANPCFGKSKPTEFSAAASAANSARFEAGDAESATAAADLDDEVSAVTGYGRRKLLATQQEMEPPAMRCPFYTELLTAAESVPACTTDGVQQMQGVWFGASVRNGWLRQVRLQANVPGSADDPSIYIAGIVMSTTEV